MSHKRICMSLLSLCLIATLTYQPIHAEDFAGQESHYIKLCSSSKLTSKQQKTCKQFNTYLNDKNKKLAKEAKDTKKDVQETKKSIDDIAQEISKIDTKIQSAKSELNYVQKNITALQKKVTNQNQQLQERLYTMQTTMNSNLFVTYIFGAESFTDFISRVVNFKEITSYEHDLVKQLNENLDEIKKQESTLKQLKSSLETDKTKQASLQKTFQAKLLEQNKTIASNSSQVSKNQESMEKIQANLAALQKAANESKVSNVTHATPNKKPSKPSTKPDTNNQQKPDNTPQGTPSNDDLTSNEELGLKIANKALSRLGYMYVWGGGHSMSSITNPNWTQFDCSGLVNWAHYQAGVNIGVQYTGSLVGLGKSVSRNNLQAGDIILFSSNGTSGGVHHVGIYIGNNQMVHAPTTGSPISVANLSYNYWQKEWYTCRRLY